MAIFPILNHEHSVASGWGVSNCHLWIPIGYPARYSIHILQGLVGLDTPLKFNMELENKGFLLRFISASRVPFSGSGRQFPRG